MSCRRPNQIMTRGRNLITTMILAATIILFSSRASEAQDQTPTPQMLLNLDLFTPQAGSHQQGQRDDDSMLEQLRALRAMGYLSPDGPLPEVDDSDEAASAPLQAIQKSRGEPQ
jgi:hypothetical protein